MGEGIIKFWNSRLRKEYKIAFFSTLIISLLVHLYKFTNTLPGHDSVLNYYTDQNILGSGRWALSLACGISSFYDLPWVVGVISCVFIALTVVVIVALFKMRNPVLIGLAGAFLAASPSTTETFFFEYTADGYMIAMLLAAAAVYLSRIDEKRISRHIISAVCICVSCGIYQAYVSFALILAICYFICVLFEDSHSKEECLKWILRQAIIYISALAVYYAIWKLCMHFTGTLANDYLGISSIGKMNMGMLAAGAIKTVTSTAMYFLQWNFLKYGLTFYGVLSILFMVLFATALIIAVTKSKLFKRKWAVVLLALCILAVCPCACMWYFTSDEVWYSARMLQSLNLFYILAALLFERWCDKALAKNLVCIFLAVIAWNNAIVANICYFHMNQSYERSYAEGLEMMSEIRELQEEYEFDKIAVVGVRLWDVLYDNHDPETGKITKYGEIYLLSSVLESVLLYDPQRTTNFLQETYGMDLEPLSPEQRNALIDTDEVKAMGCWPSNDSIAVVDGVCIIKLSEIKEW